MCDTFSNLDFFYTSVSWKQQCNHELQNRRI